jgi:hypothetical protein
MSAEEVRSLFGDIVEGLAFLVGVFDVFLLFVACHNMFVVLARQIDLAPGPQAW